MKEIKSDMKEDWNVFEAKVRKKIAKIKEAVNSYRDDVQTQNFPSKEEEY